MSTVIGYRRQGFLWLLLIIFFLMSGVYLQPCHARCQSLQAEALDQVTDYYLAVLTSGYPQEMVVSELSHVGVKIVAIENDILLFGITYATQSTPFLKDYPFAQAVYGARDKGKLPAHILATDIGLAFEKHIRIQRELRAAIITGFDSCPDHDQTYLMGRIPPMPLVIDTQPRPISITPRDAVNGEIRGRVTRADTGAGIANAWVSCYAQQHGVSPDRATTNVDGYFVLENLAPGGYRISFGADGFSGIWYNGKDTIDSADTVAVSAGQTTDGINTLLATGGTITGTLTGTGGVPIADFWVVAYTVDNAHAGSAWTAADGTYSLGGLAEGTYKVHFDARYYSGGTWLSEWYDEKSNFCSATEVHVTRGGTTSSIDAQLTQSQSIAGRVVNQAGNPIQGVYVGARSATNYQDWDSQRNAWTDESGDYTITGLAPGAYRVNFGNTGNYIGAWYSGKNHYCDAAILNVPPSNPLTGINAVLNEGGSISGVLTDGDNNALEGYVYAYDADYNYVKNGYSDYETGAYTISGLPPGGYRLQAHTYAHGYPSIWYDDKTSFEEADIVSVVKGQDTADKNFRFVSDPDPDPDPDTGGQISGKVTDALGFPLGWASVRVYRASDCRYHRGVSTNSSGEFIVNVPSGSWKVRFEPPYRQNYTAQWYNNQPDCESADPIDVGEEEIVSDINGALERGGIITGLVTDTIGNPLESGSVDIWDSTTGSGYWGNIYCGRYVIQGLPTGSYNLYVSPNTPFDIGKEHGPVTVSAGASTEADITLSERGGAISGKMIHRKSGTPMWNTSGNVVLFKPDQNHAFRYGYLDWMSCGNYMIRGVLSDQQYQVQYNFYSPVNSSIWYRDKKDRASANLIGVKPGHITQNIDCIYNQGGVPLPAVNLLLLDD